MVKSELCGRRKSILILIRSISDDPDPGLSRQAKGDNDDAGDYDNDDGDGGPPWSRFTLTGRG